MKNKLLSAIGLCKRAGKLVMGFDLVVDTISSGKACGIFLCKDLSPKSGKSITRICEEWDYTPEALPVTMDELAFIVGRRTGILAVTDPGLAKKITTLIGNCKEELEND